ncbi:MAG: hypothetical protein EXS09_05285 [Gemmataceae bacterium]|nr:hypothetical protein [Gemmataceae bacterium]
MPEWLKRYLPEGWDSTEFLIAAIAFTAATFVVSIVSVGIVVVRLPRNYFAGDHSPPMWADRHALVRWPLRILKNLLGVLLVAIGIVMSLPGVPGQGILTVLIGAMLLDFPGKRSFEKWLLRRRGVLNAINKLRSRYSKPPLELDSPAVSP